MYLVSWYEDEGILEASLGGRVNSDEVRVLGEELVELLESVNASPFTMILDYSKAKRLDGRAVAELAWVKDQCFDLGATQIVNVVENEQDLLDQTTSRFQLVMEGKERFVYDANEARTARTAIVQQLARAA